jgi:hypothetical protein
MTTSAADSPLTFGLGNLNSIPIIASDIVYEGSMVGDNGAGYGRPLVAGDKFVGHAKCKCDNAGGSAGDKNIELISGKRYRLIVDLVALITDVGQPVYASDDATLSLAAAITTTANSFVGVITRYVSATQMEVEFRPGECDEFGSNMARVVKSTNYTITAADNGRIIYVDTTAVVITLLATVQGFEVTIVNAGASAVTLITVTPDGADLYTGGCGLAALADGVGYKNTAATAKRGDFIKVVGDGEAGGGWNIVAKRGTWETV